MTDRAIVIPEIACIRCDYPESIYTSVFAMAAEGHVLLHHSRVSGKGNGTMIIILNFSRSGGTLLNRILGMLPDTVVASEINPSSGTNPANHVVRAHLALKEQMKLWYDIELGGESFSEVLGELNSYCRNSGKHLIIRDWSHNDFRKGKFNDWKPSGRFTILEKVGEIDKPVALALVSDAIDVYLSNLDDIEDFSSDYLRYAKKLVELNIPVIRYEDLIDDPEATIKGICELTSIPFNESYKSFHLNDKCTGDTRHGNASRGNRERNIVKMPRKRVGRNIVEKIDSCEDLIEANNLLGYTQGYWNGNVESVAGMVGRKYKRKAARLKKKFWN